MMVRSVRSTVTFHAPFALPGYVGDLPAGRYAVVVEEERLQGVSFEAWRRIATTLTMQQGQGGHAGRSRSRSTSPDDLAEALRRDAAAMPVPALVPEPLPEPLPVPDIETDTDRPTATPTDRPKTTHGDAAPSPREDRS